MLLSSSHRGFCHYLCRLALCCNLLSHLPWHNEWSARSSSLGFTAAWTMKELRAGWSDVKWRRPQHIQAILLARISGCTISGAPRRYAEASLAKTRRGIERRRRAPLCAFSSAGRGQSCQHDRTTLTRFSRSRHGTGGGSEAVHAQGGHVTVQSISETQPSCYSLQRRSSQEWSARRLPWLLSASDHEGAKTWVERCEVETASTHPSNLARRHPCASGYRWL